MPMPLWWGHVNKRVFNPLELRRGKRPVIRHVGRSSGSTFRTPLDAHRVDGGYVFILVYGPESDWVKNVMAAGTATLEIEGGDVPLVSPRLLAEDEAWRQLPDTTKAPPGLLRITDFLRMDTVSP